MPDYKQGKIYIIRNTENDKVYIGSTCQTLCQRMTNHRKFFKYEPNAKTKFYTAMKEVGIDKFYIELIEKYECNDKEELNAREGYWIRNYDSYNNGYNTAIPGRKQKEWYEKNKEKLTQYQKQYLEENKEKIRQRAIQYYEKNKEKIRQKEIQYYEKNREKRKEYYETNKDKINQAKRERRKQKKAQINQDI